MKVSYVVVDSGPIIKGASLENFSKHAISVPGVIKEIKDVKTRERMRNLPPYFFAIQSPDERAIKHVIDVSKKTGDIKVLSKVDIEVLALAYEMQYLKTHTEVEEMFEKPDFDSDLECDNKEVNQHFLDESDSEALESIDVTDSEEESEDLHHFDCAEIIDELNEIDNSDVTTYTPSFDDNPGWITADNFEEMKSTNFGMQLCDADSQIAIDKLPEIPLIGCLTTDYAMQNVLLHMNIPILSIDGLIVKEPRIFVSWCRACFKKFKRTDIYFCPACGNDNLGKIPAKIKENGEMELFMRKNFQPNLQNSKFSIPTPKGGKHIDGNFYIYCADQRLPREEKKKSKYVFDLNEGGNIPFVTHEVTAKSSVLNIHQGRGGNLKPSKPKGKSSKFKK